VFKINFDLLKGLGPHLVIFGKAPHQDPSTAFEPEDVHSHNNGINQPDMPNAMVSIDRHFYDLVGTKGIRRKDFTHPIWSNRNPVVIFFNRKSFSFPAGQVGDHDMPSKPDLRFINKNPSTRSAAFSKIIRRPYFVPQDGCCARMS